ncbi:MAG: type I-B CRISPR-associated protein Cas7/Cst2/DevR [Candidatus Electrothrix sp. AR4]|nr:type I-B CRISPR-associated protein Cas7/Cst2/DevR [Candidatus Electrothrix sp. AR4]
MNLFCTVLTYTAPSANYRGESAENRAVIQKITKGRFEYPIISPEAIRNALRETFAAMDLPCNRKRLHDEEQLAVEFKDYPDADSFVDDFFMGWLVAAGKNDRKKIAKELKEKGRDPERFMFKRDSILRMNMAVALEPYRHNSVFTQSPQDLTPKDVKGCKNTENSQLLHREVTCTPFQYPFALNLKECSAQQEWTQKLLEAVGQLNGVAGNHARSYFEMAPASLVVRLTPKLVAGYDTYGFSVDEQGKHNVQEVVEGIVQGDYPGEEFWLGGKLVKDMDAQLVKELGKQGAHLERNSQNLLAAVGNTMFSGS